MLVRRPPDGLLGGLWAFPEREVSGPAEAAGAASAIAEVLGISPTGTAEPLPVRKHRFTHLRATYFPFALSATATARLPDAVWVDAGETKGRAMPVAQRRVLESFVERDTLDVGADHRR